MYRFHTGGHRSPKIATAMTPKKTALHTQAKVEPRSAGPDPINRKPKPGNRASLVAKPTGQTFQPEKCLARRMGPGRKERLHLTQATRSARCTMHLTQRWRLEVTMLGTFQEIDVIGVADCLVQCHGFFGAENTIPNRQNGNGLLSVQLIQKYSPKSKTIFTKLAKPDVSTFTWKLSKEHYGCYSSVPWPLNVDQWAPACSCGWHLRSRFKPDSHEPAPSQASQGRFCSTKIIWGVCGRQVALSLVRKPKDVKNSMRIATLISVHRPPKV